MAPRFEAELASLNALRDKPAGTLRISSADYAANTILLPKLAKLLPKYPDIEVEIGIDDRLVDIVADRFDAGVRDGEQVAKDMIAKNSMDLQASTKHDSTAGMRALQNELTRGKFCSPEGEF